MVGLKESGYLILLAFFFGQLEDALQIELVGKIKIQKYMTEHLRKRFGTSVKF